MNANTELRLLTNEEVDAVAGGEMSFEVLDGCAHPVENTWAGWIFKNFNFCVTG